MIEKLTALIFLSLLSHLGFGQTIKYGNNAAAGKYYEVRGIKLYVEVYGEGPPLLMLHGNGGSIESFSENIPYFAKKYKVIAVDSRAQGKSIDNGSDLTFEMMADDFAALLDEMHIPAAYVLGWSDGGINALVMAMRHPNKVLKLAATGANLTPNDSVFADGNYRYMEHHYLEHVLIPKITEKQRTEWKLFLLDYEQPNIPFMALKVIKCPALIICGDHDVITEEHTRQIAQHIAKAKLWVVPNSGHGTLIEHKDEFNKMVDEFFNR